MDQPLPCRHAKRLRGGVRGSGILQPKIVLKESENLSSEEAALGQQMSSAFATHGNLIGKVGPEQDQGFGIHPAVLDEAEAHRVDARAPGDVGQVLARARNGIGDPRPVDVEGEPALPCDFPEGGDLGGAIDQAIFGRIGDRERRGLDLVNVLADEVECSGCRIDADLGSGAVEQNQLGAAGEKTRTAGFIDLDVRVLVAEDATVRRAQRREREAVGCGSARHPERADWPAEQVGEGSIEALAPLVTVIGGVEPVCGGDRLHHFRVHRSGIVGEETHVASSQAHSLSHGKAQVIGSHDESAEETEWPSITTWQRSWAGFTATASSA